MSWFESLVSWLANLIQIATALFTIYVVWRARRQVRNLLRVHPQASSVPVAIAVGIDGSIEGAVRKTLTATEHSMDVFVITREGFIGDEKYYDVLRELRKLKIELTARGITEVHLFYKGPVTLATGVGALLDNWVPVRVYELNRNTGLYRPVLVLGKGAVFDLLDEIAHEGETAVWERVIQTPGTHTISEPIADDEKPS